MENPKIITERKSLTGDTLRSKLLFSLRNIHT